MRSSPILVLLAAVLLAGCGGDGSSSGTPAADLAVPWVDPDGDPPSIGSLSVNPGDGSLMMGTNTGLFEIPKAGGRPAKVTGRLKTSGGEGAVSESLVAEYTGPDELLASGHPSGDSTLPPALGLIRSADAARTWQSVSELGTSDFHALSSAGDLLVAPLYGQAQILLSRDAGRTFEPRVARFWRALPERPGRAGEAEHGRRRDLAGPRQHGRRATGAGRRPRRRPV